MWMAVLWERNCGRSSPAICNVQTEICSYRFRAVGRSLKFCITTVRRESWRGLERWGWGAINSFRGDLLEESELKYWIVGADAITSSRA